jgi:hypothetical protein
METPALRAKFVQNRISGPAPVFSSFTGTFHRFLAFRVHV